MPGVDCLFGDMAEIVKVNGRQISNRILRDADALLCRSITKVNQSLLENTAVKFVGTATIGVDHLDIGWLEKSSINWSNAAGCNAAAVAQYVLSAISFWCLNNHKEINQLTVGIVGAGNVGTELSLCLKQLGINYQLCDPPLKQQGDQRSMVEFNNILKCDVITLHVPLTCLGEYQTHFLIDNAELNQLSQQQLLINASRGAVINNQSLSNHLKQENSVNAVIDVFENEPNISQQMLSKCLLGTPHIAGHTLEGKLRGSWLIYKAFCENFAEPLSKLEMVLYPEKNTLVTEQKRVEEVLLEIYDIRLDASALNKLNEESFAIQFDQLRKNATRLSNGLLRRDYSGWLLPKWLEL